MGIRAIVARRDSLVQSDVWAHLYGDTENFGKVVRKRLQVVASLDLSIPILSPTAKVRHVVTPIMQA